MGAVSVGSGHLSQKRKYFYGRTREEVAKKLTNALKSVQDNAPLPSDRVSVASFAKDWLASIRPSIRPRTYKGYESALRVHIVPKLGNIALTKLEPFDLEHLYSDLISSGLSPFSVRNYHRRIHTMLEKALRIGVIVRNVAKLADLPRLPQKEMVSFTPQQVRDFVRAAEKHRLEALFVTAITTGARQGELLGLTWDRIDLTGGMIDIRYALQRIDGLFELVEPKTQRSIRKVALTNTAVTALRRHRTRQLEEALRLGPVWNNEMNLVFTTSAGTPLDKDNVTKRQYRPVLKLAGLDTKLRFHDLRHIAATLALSQGVPIPVVSEMLGHVDAATTLRVYAHVIQGAQRQAADAFEAVLAV